VSKKQLLIDEFIKGKVSRRDFHAGLIGMGLTAAAATTLIEQSISKAEAQEPVAGGRIVVAADSSHAGDTLDPAKVVQAIDISRAQLLGARLVDWFPETGLTPNLATEWEANADSTQWRFKMLQGAEFHNGKTVTAEDVVYSFNRHLDPSEGSVANAYLGDVESFAADGEYFVVNLKSTNLDIPSLMAVYQFTVHPEGQTAADYAAGRAVAAGPFKVEEFDPGIVSIFSRHENYHKNGRPYLDEIEFFAIPDNGARVNALITGEVDVIIGVEGNLVRQVEASDSARILSQPGGAHPTYPMRADLAPYDNNDVRMALKWAVDRERLLDLGFDNLGVIARDHPVPPHDPFWCEEVPQPMPDPDKVKYHLKKAGHENTVFELTAADTNFGGANASVVMAELMRENGVNVQINRVPSDGYWSAVWLVAPWCGSSWYGRPTADQIMAVAYTSDAAWNESHWKNPAFDQLLLDARKELDPATRKQMYCDLQMMMATEGSTITPVFINWTDGLGNRVQGMKGHPHMYVGSLYWDDVWLDDSKA